jgi:membrane protein DedA with SNARE-associated domain
MKYRTFSLMTLLGSFAWSVVLAWFGARVLGGEPRLMQDPDALVHVLKTKLVWFVGAAAVLLVLYIVVDLLGRRPRPTNVSPRA